MDDLHNKELISKELKNSLSVSNPRCGKFRILLKLHKLIFSERPIINCIGTPISICLFYFSIFQLFIILTESFLQDSQHLLQILDNIDFSQYEKIFQYSGDFEFLYTNKEREFAIDLILEFVREKKALGFRHVSFEALKILLEIVFDKNIFRFKSHFYKQKKAWLWE